MGAVLSIIFAIVALGVLIIFHEAGHYWVAKRSGMSVSRFSIGFGPVLYETERNGTLFQVAAIPLGGFVQIDGMDPEDELEDPSKGFEAKPFHLKFATILAGPVANYLLGFLILFVGLAFFYEKPMPPIRMVSVAADSAASEAGLQEGDLLLGTDSASFQEVSDFGEAIQSSQGKAIQLRVKRGDEELQLPITPREAGGRYLVGVQYEGAELVSANMGVAEAALSSAKDLVSSSWMMLSALPALFKKGSGAEVSGPIGIVRVLSGQMDRSWQAAIPTVARLSVMLGLFNLLPIPALDGSRLLFLLIGAIRRKRVSPKVENYVHLGGLILMLGLFVVISFNDILSWVRH